MTTRPTTPFGRETILPADVAAKIQTFAERADAYERVAHKWKVLAGLSTAARLTASPTAPSPSSMRCSPSITKRRSRQRPDRLALQ